MDARAGYRRQTGISSCALRVHLTCARQDFHLAKRYYDQALETNAEAYLPVFLSLLKLHARSVYHALKGGDMKSITVQSPFSARTTGEDAHEASTAQRWAAATNHLVHFRFHQAVAEIVGALPASEPSAAQDQKPEATLQDAQRALSEDGDPVRWAREQQEREALQVDGEEEEYLESLGQSGDGDLLESVAIVALCLGVAWLFWYRQARVEAARLEQRRQQVANGL
jgi:SEL1 protein